MKCWKGGGGGGTRKERHGGGVEGDRARGGGEGRKIWQKLSRTCQIQSSFLPRLEEVLILLVISLHSVNCKDNTEQSCINHPTMGRQRGVIQSTHYPQPYDVHTCEQWFIQGDQHDVITISFRDLDIPVEEDESDCKGESYLELGPTPEVRLCGGLKNQIPEVYISQREHVWLKFRGSGRILGRGFSLQYIRGRQPYGDRCLQDEFSCLNGKCILHTWRCNGADECGDGSDETNCTHGISRLTTPGPWACGQHRFGCFDQQSRSYRCFMNARLCDGTKDCHDGGDEKHCDPLHHGCVAVLTDPAGVITSPNFPHAYPAHTNCGWSIEVNYGEKVQLRFQTFSLGRGYNSDYVKIYDGATEEATAIGQYYEGKHPPAVIESTENTLFIQFHSEALGHSPGFNVTYQTKGRCLRGQQVCGFGERDCFLTSQRCDNVWHCPQHGGDERGCGKCVKDKFLCREQEMQCFSESEHCDGNNHCRNGRDEEKCTPAQCGPHNGTFLCDNHHCIFESWCCDGTDDCQDGSDEIHCSRPSVKVITAAVIGSLICGLLLVIALGCTCKLYALRLHEAHASLRHTTPISRMTEEIFARRLAPPTYNEAMLTSRPYEEAYQEYMEQLQRARSQRTGGGRRGRHSRSNRGQNTPQGQVQENVTSQTDADDVPLIDITQGDEGGHDDAPLSLSSDCDGDDSDSNFDPTDSSNVNISLATGMTAQWRRTRRGKRSGGSDATRVTVERSGSGQDGRDSIETASASTDSVVISLDEENSKVEEDVAPLVENPEVLREQTLQLHSGTGGSDGESEQSEMTETEAENAIITAEVHAETRPLHDR